MVVVISGRSGSWQILGEKERARDSRSQTVRKSIHCTVKRLSTCLHGTISQNLLFILRSLRGMELVFGYYKQRMLFLLFLSLFQPESCGLSR